MTTPCPVSHHRPPHVATNITPTTAHPNPHAMSTSTPLPISPLNRVRRRGLTKIRIKITINTTMAHTPQLAPLRGDDPLHGQSSPLPPQSIQLPTPVHHPGRIYVTATTDSTSPPHLPPVPRHGLLSPAISIIPCITAKTLSAASNAKPKRSPDYFRNTIEVSV